MTVSPVPRGRILGLLPVFALVFVASLCLPSASWPRDELVDLPLPKGGPQRVFANGGDHIFIHDVGLLKLRVSNLGIFGNPFDNGPGASWLGGEYLFASGLWIGAVGGDAQKHVSTAFAPGSGDVELLPEIDDIWTIRRSFEGILGGKRVTQADPKGANDDLDDWVDEDFHDGLDNDGDELIDEDFQAISSQMFSCLYKDDTAEALAFNSEHFPLNLLVKQRTMAWSSAGLNEFVGVDFEIVNNGDQSLKDVYIGFFSDSDAGPPGEDGYWADDLVGWMSVDTLINDPNKSAPCNNRRTQFDAVYMWDAPDDGNQAQGGDVPGVFGSLFLGHTTDPTGTSAPLRVGLHTVAWFSSQGEETDPRDDIERYDLMSRGTRPGRPANKPEDYRYVISTDKFSRVGPGESLIFQTAYVIGDGIKGFRRNAVTAQRVFDGDYVDADEDPFTGMGGRERCLQILEEGTAIFWQDPCDTSSLFPESHEIRIPGPCIYVDDDCDACTGIDGREHLSNWVGITPPPAPSLEILPGNERVTLRWDNTSENHLNPFTGRPFFAGYEIWRCDTWDRPQSSAGPDASLFKKVMTLWWENSNLGLPPSNFVTNSVSSRMLREFTHDVPQAPDKNPNDDFTPYEVGRYEFTDDLGVINGMPSFYVVTAFAVQENELGIPSIVGSLPSALEEDMIFARADVQEEAVDCDRIYAVPNPYYGAASWDLEPSDEDPTGTKIGLVGLPSGNSTVRIYTMSGDLVLRDTHWESQESGGTYWWDLVTQSGQDAVSGVYLFTVEHDEGVCRGKFIVIR